MAMWGFSGCSCLGSVGLPIPDETLLMFTGYLIFKHELEPLPAFAAGFWEASVASPSAMRWSHAWTVFRHRLGRFLHVVPEDLDHVRAWYEGKGKYGLVISYFIPGIRHLAGLCGGVIAVVPAGLRDLCLLGDCSGPAASSASAMFSAMSGSRCLRLFSAIC